jgi:hypothetical protein
LKSDRSFNLLRAKDLYTLHHPRKDLYTLMFDKRFIYPAATFGFLYDSIDPDVPFDSVALLTLLLPYS